MIARHETQTEPASDDAIDAAPFAFKARLQILGVVREDVGIGKDYKQASTDAFKRAAVRVGIGNELYSFDQNWVPMDGDGKYAKAVEDPSGVYERRGERRDTPTLPFSRGLIATDVPPCPKCGGRLWDNRIGKRNPRAPDFKCRDRGCDGVIWPGRATATASGDGTADATPPVAATGTNDQIPF